MIAAGRRVRVAPQLKREIGIQAARTIFWEVLLRRREVRRRDPGSQALRYEVDEAKSDPSGNHISVSKVPRHDWASHAADAAAIREPERKKEQEKRRPASRLSPWS